MLDHKQILYKDQDVVLEGYSVFDSDEKRPLVIFCHAWKGRDKFICDKADKAASLGFASFVLDVYGKGILGATREECIKLKTPFLKDRNLLQRRLLKGYEQACNNPYVDPARCIAIGYGFGGLCALDLARSGINLKGVISIYGHYDMPSNVISKPIKAEVLILHGYKDPVTTMEDLDQFQQSLDRDGTPWQTCLYGEAFHAFATPSANDPSNGVLYNPTCAQRAWKQIKYFLEDRR